LTRQLGNRKRPYVLIDYVRQSGLVDPDRLMSYLEGLESQGPVPEEPPKLAACLVRDGLPVYGCGAGRKRQKLQAISSFALRQLMPGFPSP